MNIADTHFKAKCLEVINQVAKEKSRFTITRHGKPVAELIPVSASLPGKLFGRSRNSTTILGNLISTEECWSAED